jgi:transaldolase
MTDQATKPNNHLIEIKEYGQSIWMDNLTRDIFSLANSKLWLKMGYLWNHH